MIQRAGNFSEWDLAEYIKQGPYIDLYKKGSVAYVPYMDLPTGEKKFMKFVFEEAIGWVYVDNSQNG